MTFALVWFGGCNSPWLSVMLRDDLTDVRPDDRTRAEAIESVVERIIKVESNGDPNAKNKRSSATGLGQFLDETWLDLIRTHRPDLAKGRSADETLELRRDPKVARELTVRFTEQNAGMLRKRGLPVTPGTLYLAHFAGGAGAVALLSALEDADAASVMANADATGRTKREKIIKANPFLERFTVADLKSWAHRKMRAPL
jgi:Transglycosylase SLT domain